MILVTGATGTVGGALFRALASMKSRDPTSMKSAIRILARDPAKLPADAKFHAVQGAYDDPAALDRALDGVSALFLLTKPSPGQPALENSVAEAAKRHGIARIVRLSAMAADASADSPVRRWHGECEAAVRDSGIPVASLRANYFMQNIAALSRGIAERGMISLPAGEARVSMVDVRDIADCAALLLTENNFRSGDWALTGPQSLSFAEVAEEVARIRGAPVHYRPGDIGDFIEKLAGGSLPRWLAEALGALYRDFQAGLNQVVDSAVEKLTGKPARALSAYLAEIAPRLAPTA